MKMTAIVRKVDELGRIVLPIELRRAMDISEKDELEIYLDEDRLILKKYENSCVFCRGNNSLVIHRGRAVCADCIQALNDL
ncbi:MAG: AbrB/MazE/SpoVT family DNA-binding domain-containing protein [Oscillospiraceae bacterium]|nr:AbrB/MazE/SpoVT family DNA-binding domain-containing protein [Oscillospiraceae bacterium]